MTSNANWVSELFEPSLADELEQVRRAVSYYERAQSGLLGSAEGREIAAYYQVSAATSRSKMRFKALFFATRLQPALDYVARFQRELGRPPRMLDVGCGYGLETTLLAAAGAEITGVDHSRVKVRGAGEVASALRKAAGTDREIRYTQAEVTVYASRHRYDAVYSSATLHHIEPVLPACRAIAALLEPHGVFFLSDENGASPAQQLAVQHGIGWRSRRIVSRQDPETGQSTLYGNENIRPVFVWKRILGASGLAPLGLKYCRFLPPLDVGLDLLLRGERGLRAIPLLRELGAIGFIAGFGPKAPSRAFKKRRQAEPDAAGRARASYKPDEKQSA
jgi:2-polyprenyl-3-methyl-5-hydroxy-6-metoxy-1,4-benzoquinol methylase